MLESNVAGLLQPRDGRIVKNSRRNVALVVFDFYESSAAII